MGGSGAGIGRPRGETTRALRLPTAGRARIVWITATGVAGGSGALRGGAAAEIPAQARQARQGQRHRHRLGNRAHRLGGLIFVTNPEFFTGTLIVTEQIPSVAVKSSSVFGIPSVYPDLTALVEGSLDYLQASGRKRIAMIGYDLSLVGKYSLQRFQADLAARGMTTRPFWNLQLSHNLADGVRACADLLMHCSERPDGIVIIDDNLVPNFTAGLLASGVRIPDDLEVVAHANFPWPTQSMVPVRRVGFDIHRMLELCVEIIAAQRDGKSVPELTLLPPCFQTS